ncbi:major facilitator superfamily domain-containing protein [Stachybotrys elegans]|uniref:Major facilitator superfamily domain-containing protein n=1 Tax=Stachybotrys elegans TaxID=80388 RepID=A0A8K0SJX0_9HYPO|nr:major facilitator superfamily domain-containing protein [Stachybotrys elegans]
MESASAQAPSGGATSPDAQMSRRVLKKIDRAIIPLAFIMYMLNFSDKVILSSAAVFGLRDDNNLQGQQYSWVASIFYFGYLVWAYPTTRLITILPTAKYLAANTFFWGTVVALTAACTNFGGLMTVRALLGVAEATITPALMFLTSTWYTRDEMPTRLGIWFAGNSIGGLTSSLLAFGLGHIEDNVGAWRWMYIFLGVSTFLYGIPVLLLLPDSISKARFLTPDERRIAAERVVVAGTGSTENTHWNYKQFIECLIDPKTWFVFGVELLTQIPNGATQNFSNIVVKSFGFSSLHSTLINIPYSILTASIIAGTGWLAGRFNKLNCLLIIAVIIPCVVGSSIMYQRDSVPHGVQLFAYFLMAPGPAAMPLNMALVQSNYRGVTKKMTITALLFLAYCAGNIAGPQFFDSTEAPKYPTAFRTIMICYALAMSLALGHRFYLQWLNAKRVREEGFEGSASMAGALTAKGSQDGETQTDVDATIAAVEIRPEDYEDVTDWNTLGFRYRL